MELLMHNRLTSLLSSEILCKLSKNDFYNKDIFNKYIEIISQAFFDNDIESIKNIYSDLVDKKEEYSDSFNEKSKILNEMHFKLRGFVKNELIAMHKGNTNPNTDVTLYKNIESEILNNLKTVFQEKLFSSEKTTHTYRLLLDIVRELKSILEFKSRYE